jgi:hypothetical protein
MDALDCIRHIESIIDHKFSNQYWPTLALTAAGAEESNHDGNRMCARWGREAIQLYVLKRGHGRGDSPGTKFAKLVAILKFCLANI